MNTLRLFLLTVFLLGLACVPADAATRLGLHVTQEELNIWVQRSANGPYKTEGDVSTNSPGDWDRILANANSGRSNPSADRWPGWTDTTRCMSMNDAGPGRRVGAKIRDAAFAYLVTGITSYRDAIRTELLAQAVLPALNFADTTRFLAVKGTSCLTGNHGPVFDMASYMTRMLYAYDYINARSSTAFTAAQKTTINTWLLNAGMLLSKRADEIARDRWPNRASDNYTPPSPMNSSIDQPDIYFGGPGTSAWQRFCWANIGLTDMNLAGSVGIVVNNTTLKNRAKRFFQEFIQFGIFANGDSIELARWLAAEPFHAFGYTASGLGMATTIADHFARAGDPSLYNYSTSNGYDPGTRATTGPNTTAGGPKTLSLAIGAMNKFVNRGVTRYATANCNGNINYRIDTEYPTLTTSACVGEAALPDTIRFIWDIWSVPANLFYNVAGRQAIYMRTAANTVPYPAQRYNGGYEPWSGLWGEYPGIMFQFAQNEGIVNPFDFAAPTPPTVELHANPTTTTTTSDLTWTSTNTTTCTGSCNNADCDDWDDTKPSNGGPETVSPAATTTYTLTCTGPGGTVADSVIVTFAPPIQGFRVSKFQFRPFAGSEASPQTANPNADFTIFTADAATTMIENGSIGVQFRVECDAALQCPAGPLPLRFRKNGVGSYTALTDTCGDLCYCNAPDVGHAQATTNRVTGSGTFEAGHIIETVSVPVSEDLAAGEATNMLYMLCAGDLTPGDYVELQPYQANGEAFANYVATPRIDIGQIVATRSRGGLSSGGGLSQ